MFACVRKLASKYLSAREISLPRRRVDNGSFLCVFVEFFSPVAARTAPKRMPSNTGPYDAVCGKSLRMK